MSKAEEHFEVDYFSEDPLVNIASESASSSPSTTPKYGNRFSSNTDRNSLSPLFFSPRGKGHCREIQHDGWRCNSGSV